MPANATSATEARRLLIDVSSPRRSLIGVVLFYFDFAFPVGALRLRAFLVRVAEIEKNLQPACSIRFCCSRSSHWKTKWWIPAYSSRRENNTESLLGMLFITSVRYWINFVHTGKYKIKPHAIAIDTSQIAILPSLGTCP